MITLKEIVSTVDSKDVAAVCIYPNDDTVLLCKRASGKWSVPKGHIKLGEQPIDAAVRELLEETKIALSPENLTLLSEQDYKDKGSRVWIYRHDSNGNFYTPVLDKEHTDFKYFNIKELPENLDKSIIAKT